jgi:hypothetical protein
MNGRNKPKWDDARWHPSVQNKSGMGQTFPFELPAWHAVATCLRELADAVGDDFTLVERLTAGMRSLDQQLRNFSAYRYSVQSVPQVNPGASDWVWQELGEKSFQRAGMLTIFANAPMPMHDHPGTSGAALILHGSVRIKQFDIKAVHDSDHRSMVELIKTNESIYHQGALASFFAERGNIHTLEAVSDCCAALCVHINAYDWSDRHWYFPVFPYTGYELVFLAHRVRTRVGIRWE